MMREKPFQNKLHGIRAAASVPPRDRGSFSCLEDFVHSLVQFVFPSSLPSTIAVTLRAPASMQFLDAKITTGKMNVLRGLFVCFWYRVGRCERASSANISFLASSAGWTLRGTPLFAEGLPWQQPVISRDGRSV